MNDSQECNKKIDFKAKLPKPIPRPAPFEETKPRPFPKFTEMMINLKNNKKSKQSEYFSIPVRKLLKKPVWNIYSPRIVNSTGLKKEVENCYNISVSKFNDCSFISKKNSFELNDEFKRLIYDKGMVMGTKVVRLKRLFSLLLKIFLGISIEKADLVMESYELSILAEILIRKDKEASKEWLVK